MKRQGDQGRFGQDAVFHSSRRVSFVVRSDIGSRRFSSSRVSRDPMEAMQVDVRPEPSPTPPALGLESDWSDLSESLDAVVSGRETLRLWNRDTGEDFAASAVRQDGAFYIALADVKADAGSELIEIESALFDRMKSHREVLTIDLGSDHNNRLISFDSARDIFAPAIVADVAPAPEQPPEPKAPDVALVAPATAPPPKVAPVVPANKETPPKPTAKQDDAEPVSGASRLRALTSPRGFPDSLQTALVNELRPLSEAFNSALLFQVEYVAGQTEYLVGFVKASASLETELESAVNSALASSKRHDVELGITFLEAEDPMTMRISRVGQRLV